MPKPKARPRKKRIGKKRGRDTAHCPKCGSARIEGMCWVPINLGNKPVNPANLGQPIDGHDSIYCSRCEEHSDTMLSRWDDWAEIVARCVEYKAGRLPRTDPWGNDDWDLED